MEKQAEGTVNGGDKVEEMEIGVVVDEKLKLENMPAIVHETILEHLPMIDKLRYRICCSKMQIAMDNASHSIEELVYLYGFKHVGFYIPNVLRVTIGDRHGQQWMERTGKEEKAVNGDKHQLLVNNLTPIFQLKKLKIEKLSIMEIRTNDGPRFEVEALIALWNLLKSLNHKLKVVQYDNNVLDLDEEIMGIMECFDKENFKKLLLIEDCDCAHPRAFPQHLYSWDHWRKLESVNSDFHVPLNELKPHWSHFPEASVTYDIQMSGDLPVEQYMMSCINMLLENPNLKCFEVWPRNHEDYLEEAIIEEVEKRVSIRPTKKITRAPAYWADFPYPNSDQKLLMCYDYHYVFKGPQYQPRDDLVDYDESLPQNTEPDVFPIAAEREENDGFGNDMGQAMEFLMNNIAVLPVYQGEVDSDEEVNKIMMWMMRKMDLKNEQNHDVDDEEDGFEE